MNTSGARERTWGADMRGRLVDAIKFVHSAIFFANAAAVAEVFRAGLKGTPSRWTRLALGISLSESLVFIGSGFRCPLTEAVRRVSGENVRITDIFLPVWLADHIPQLFTPPLVIGLAGLLAGRFRRRQSRWPGAKEPGLGIC